MKVKLVIDRDVSKETAEVICRLIPYLTSVDTLELTTDNNIVIRAPKQEAPVAEKCKPVVAVVRPAVKENPPEKPTTGGEPVIIPTRKPVGRPRKISRMDNINATMDLVATRFPDLENSIRLFQALFAWEEQRRNWIQYEWKEVAKLISASEADARLIVVDFLKHWNHSCVDYTNPNVMLPLTMNELISRQEEEQSKVEAINIKQTGDPHIGSGAYVLHHKEMLDRNKADFLLSKLDWKSARKIYISYEELLVWFGYPYSASNARLLASAIKRNYPEWIVDKRMRYIKDMRCVINLYSFPPPVVMDPKHPFPGM